MLHPAIDVLVELFDEALMSEAEQEAVWVLVKYCRREPVPMAMPVEAVEEPRLITTADFQQVRPCERCGRSFSPSPGTTGRFCSRECYGGGFSITDRRAALLRALAIRPMAAYELRTLPEYAAVSKATVTNDLYALSNKGQVHGVDEGWAQGPVAPVSDVSTVGDDDDRPLAQSRPVFPH